MIRTFARMSLVPLVLLMATGCMQRMVAPESPDSSMAIIEPVISGKMRVGLAFNSYSYHEKPPKIMFMNNYNRLSCADIQNTETGEVISYRGFTGATQCYYPNLSAGTYSLMDYPMKREGETYKVFFLTLHNTLRFEDKKLTFSVGRGEVKHVGTYVLNMKDTGSKLVVESIDSVKGSDAVERAKLELARTETQWELKNP